MSKLVLNAWQEVVSIDDVPDDQLRDVLKALLEHLAVDIVCESTPDYTAYEIRSRDSK